MTKHTIKSIAREISESKVFKIALYSFGILVVACFIFQAGAIVGFRKASFGRDWGSNYTKNFGPRGGRMVNMLPDNFPNAHGAVGSVIKVELPMLIVEDKDKTEKVVLVTDKTEVRTQREKVRKEDIKDDDFVVVIGSPNSDGQIEARLIRILPAPPDFSVETTTVTQH